MAQNTDTTQDEVQERNVSPYDDVWFPSWATISWLTPTLVRGQYTPFNANDAPSLPAGDDIPFWSRELITNLNYYESNKYKHALLRAYLYTFRHYYAFRFFWGWFIWTIGLCSTMLMEQLLVFQENRFDPSLQAKVTMAWWSTAGFNLYEQRVLIRREAAEAAVCVYRSMFRRVPLSSEQLENLDDGASQVVASQSGLGGGGAVYNVLKFDMSATFVIIQVVEDMTLWPYQMWTVSFMLYERVYFAFLPGLITIIVMKFISLGLLAWDGVLRDVFLARKDVRTTSCAESFNAVRVLQLLGWTGSHQDVILVQRERELETNKMRFYLSKTVEAMSYISGIYVTLITLAVYTWKGGRLTTAAAMAVISLITKFGDPIGQIPFFIRSWMIFGSAYSRVKAFLGLDQELLPTPEDFPGGVCVNGVLSWKPHATNHNGNDSDDQAPLVIPLADHRNFKLSTTTCIREGQLFILLGESGSGKTSFLLAALGDMPQEAGKRVAFAAQRPVVFTGTFKSNIVFGERFDSVHYQKVLQACALEAEEKERGETSGIDGNTISGGQAKRISLARAVYRATIQTDPDEPCIVLLDEPFSSLDKDKRDYISSALLGKNGMLTNRAVVLATSDFHMQDGGGLSNFQPGHGFVMRSVITDGVIPPAEIVIGSPSIMAANRDYIDSLDISPMPSPPRDDAHQRNFRRDSDNDTLPTRSSAGSLPDAKDSNFHHYHEEKKSKSGDVALKFEEEGVQVLFENELLNLERTFEHAKPTKTKVDMLNRFSCFEVETKEEGSVAWAFYKYYAEAAGWWRVAIILSSVCGIMAFQNICTLWISYWTDKAPEHHYMKAFLPVNHPDDNTCLKVYFWLVMGFTFCNFLGFYSEIWAGIAAARTLFKNALLGVMRQPSTWWDVQPDGRVLNRFVTDTNVIDETMTMMLGVITGALWHFFWSFVFMSFFNWSIIPCLIIMVLWFEFGAACYYRINIREIYRSLLLTESIFIQDLQETLAGAETIRAYRQEPRYLLNVLSSMEYRQRVKFIKEATKVWLGLRLGLIGAVITTMVNLYPVLSFYGVMGTHSAGAVGFMMMMANQISGILQQLIFNWSDFEMQGVSVERLKQYGDLPDESKNAIFPRNWPSQGKLEIKNVSKAYPAAPNLLALNGVSLTLQPKETVAIVGPSGAGKSTLLNIVLQMITCDEGDVFLDGESLKKFNPMHLRRGPLAVVPQNPIIFRGSVRWNMDPYNEHSDEKLKQALRRVNLVVDDLDADAPSHWSVGQHQRLCLARALLRNPVLLCLDEVTASLNKEATIELMKVLEDELKSHTVLVVSHQAEVLNFVDRTVRIEKGKILATIG